MTVSEMTVHELKALIDEGANFLLLDVRTPDEYNICHLNGKLIPLNELPFRMSELNPEQQIVVYCHIGGRSRRATEFLMQQGFKKISNLRGGVMAWAAEIDPSMPQY